MIVLCVVFVLEVDADRLDLEASAGENWTASVPLPVVVCE